MSDSCTSDKEFEYDNLPESGSEESDFKDDERRMK